MINNIGLDDNSCKSNNYKLQTRNSNYDIIQKNKKNCYSNNIYHIIDIIDKTPPTIKNNVYLNSGSSNLNLPSIQNKIEEIRSKNFKNELPPNNYIPNIFEVDIYARGVFYNKLNKVENFNKFIPNKNIKLITYLVSGSPNGIKALKILGNSLISLNPSNYKILAIYIEDNSESTKLKLNFNNIKENVLESFSTTLNTIPSYANLIVDTKCTQTGYEEYNYLSLANKSSFNVLCLDSLKGPLLRSIYLTKTKDFLLSNSKIPNILLKEYNIRGSKNKGYNWFILLDHTYINSFKAFITFSEFIDKNNDFIYAFGSYPSYITYDVLQKQFIEYCEDNNYKNYAYESESYVKNISKKVIEKVNFESTYFDFVVFYNNSDKYKAEKENNEYYKIVDKVCANLCFINNLYINYIK